MPSSCTAAGPPTGSFNSAFNTRTELLALEQEFDSPELIGTSAFERPKLHCLKAGQIPFNHNSQQVAQVGIHSLGHGFVCITQINVTTPSSSPQRRLWKALAGFCHTAVVKTSLQGHGQHSSSLKLQINTLPSQRAYENSCSAL